VENVAISGIAGQGANELMILYVSKSQPPLGRSGRMSMSNICPNLTCKTSSACTTLYGCGLNPSRVSEFSDCHLDCSHFRDWMRKREDKMEREAMQV